MHKDYLGNPIKIGDYFVISTKGSSSAFLKLGRVTGWKKDRMHYVRAWNEKHVELSYTTRLSDLVVVPENSVTLSFRLAMEPVWIEQSRKLDDAYIP